MLRYWILERARQAVVGDDDIDQNHPARRRALDVFGAVTMLAVALAVF